MQTHKPTYSLVTWYQGLNYTDISGYSEVIPEAYLGLCEVFEITPFVGVVKCISPLMSISPLTFIWGTEFLSFILQILSKVQYHSYTLLN